MNQFPDSAARLSSAVIAFKAQQIMNDFVASCYKFANSLSAIDCYQQDSKEAIMATLINDSLTALRSTISPSSDTNLFNNICQTYRKINPDNPVAQLTSNFKSAGSAEMKKLCEYVISFLTYEQKCLIEHDNNSFKSPSSHAAIIGGKKMSRSAGAVTDYKTITNQHSLTQWLESHRNNVAQVY